MIFDIASELRRIRQQSAETFPAIDIEDVIFLEERVNFTRSGRFENNQQRYRKKKAISIKESYRELFGFDGEGGKKSRHEIYRLSNKVENRVLIKRVNRASHARHVEVVDERSSTPGIKHFLSQRTEPTGIINVMNNIAITWKRGKARTKLTRLRH